MNGFLLIDKPVGPTSHDMVAQVRRLLPRGTKVGHAGTLDPLASGLLILGVGPATKLLSTLVGLDKSYECTIQLGATSATDDAEGPILSYPIRSVPTQKEIEVVIASFIGEQEQLAPAFSAKKIQGERLYKKARRGEPVQPRPHRIFIKKIALVSFEFPKLQMSVDCSTGTYIRALARDIGKLLEVGGYVAQLRRTTIGPFSLQEAASLDELKESGLSFSLRTPQQIVEKIVKSPSSSG